MLGKPIAPIHWIEIYTVDRDFNPVDSVIHLLNNWAQNGISQKTREIGSLLLRPSEKFKKSETHGRILRVGRSGYRPVALRGHVTNASFKR